MTTPHADYRRIASLTDTITLIDDEGHVSKFETLRQYEIFQIGLRHEGLSLYDEVDKVWVVKEEERT